MNISKVNEALYNWWLELPGREQYYTNPYLIMPSTEYLNAKKKALILGKETNGWAQKEIEEEKTNGETAIWPTVKLERFYDEQINKKRIGANPFWNFCWELESALKGKFNNIELCYANVAVLGLPYGQRGYDPKLAEPLSIFLKDYIEALQPDVIICLTGFGTKTNTERPYLKLLNRVFGEYDETKDVIIGNQEMKYPLRKLYFPNVKIPILGTAHPERKSKAWKEDTIRSFGKFCLTL